MTNTSNEDKLEGNFGRRRVRAQRGGALFPDISVSSQKGGLGKLARAASFAAC